METSDIREGHLYGRKEYVTQKKEPESKAYLEAQITELQAQIYHLRMERDAIEAAAKLLIKAEGINLCELKNSEKIQVIDALRKDYRLKELLVLLQIVKAVTVTVAT